MLKTSYFKDMSIDRTASRMQSKLQELGLTSRRAISYESPALLVLDMQNYFLSPESPAFVPSAVAIVPKINLLIQHFKSNSLHVIFTRHSNNSENAGLMARRWSRLTPSSGDLFELCSELDTSGAKIIDKHQYDAFYRTDLESELKYHKCESLIITGVVANLCVETTSRSAFVRGFNPIVPIDATAAYNAGLHFASMQGISYSLGETPLTLNVVEGLSNANE